MTDFIDTHQHLIYRGRFGYGWTEAFEPLASGDFALDDYLSLARGAGIAASIFMETGVDDADYQGEARFAAQLVGREGVLGQIASCRPEEDEGFDAWLEECAGLEVVGFRRSLHVMPDELSQSERFRRNVRKIGASGLPFDACALARQLPLAAELAGACDNTPMILNHCGVPDIAGGAFDEWARGVDAMAELENVHVKLSGVTAYCAPGAASASTLKPWVDHVLERFGPGRMVWGGDWPVVNLGAGLPEWVALTRRLIAELSEDEQEAIASGNARRLYAV